MKLCILLAILACSVVCIIRKDFALTHLPTLTYNACPFFFSFPTIILTLSPTIIPPLPYHNPNPLPQNQDGKNMNVPYKIANPNLQSKTTYNTEYTTKFFDAYTPAMQTQYSEVGYLLITAPGC